MRKEITMKEMLQFMTDLRDAFPMDLHERYSGKVRCNVIDVSRKLNIPTDKVWEYVIACSNVYLIDNNGGELRFNDSFIEDFAEMFMLEAFADAMHRYAGKLPMGFIYNVIRNMYRDDNFCAGKLAKMRSDAKRVHDILQEVADVMNEEDSVDTGSNAAIAS